MLISSKVISYRLCIYTVRQYSNQFAKIYFFNNTYKFFRKNSTTTRNTHVPCKILTNCS